MRAVARRLFPPVARHLARLSQAFIQVPQTNNLLRVVNTRQFQLASCISLDCFDTLIHRSVDPPALALRRVGHAICTTFDQYGIALDVRSYTRLRWKIERRLRAQSQQSGEDPEFCLEHLYAELVQELLGRTDASLAQRLVQVEIENECAGIFLAHGAAEFLRACKVMGKRVVLVSDMYWPAEKLREALLGLGLSIDGCSIYVSGDIGIAKYSGRLYKHILTSEQLSSAQVLHIGDNLLADGLQAQRSGLKSVWLHDRLDAARRQSVRSFLGSLLNGRHDITLPPAGSRGVRQAGDDVSVQLGRGVFAWSFIPFVDHIWRTVVAQQRHSKRRHIVAFMARDGWILHQIAQIFAQHASYVDQFGSIQQTYLYMSRASVIPAGIQHGVDEARHFAKAMHPHGTIARIARLFGLQETDVQRAADECAIELHRVVPMRGNQSLDAFFAHPQIVSALQRARMQSKQHLLAYLQQNDCWGANTTVHLVDLGWLATSQRYLTKATMDEPDRPQFVGHFLGSFVQHGSLEHSDHSYLLPGFLGKQNDSWLPRLVRAVSLLELAACADHGSTRGYKHTEAGVEPILGPPPNRTANITTLQQGILSSVPGYIQMTRMLAAHPYWFRRRARRSFLRLAERPTREQARALAQCYFNRDYGINTESAYVSGRLSLALLLRPKRFIRAIKQTAWVEGSLRMSGVPFILPLHAVFLRLKKAMTSS